MAMRQPCQRIRADEAVIDVEERIASVHDIFRLVGNSELEAAELRYLPQRPATSAIGLAASRGRGLDRLTAARPQCLIDIRGEPLLRRLLATLNDCGVRRVTVVRGYRKEAIDLPGIATVDNDAYAVTGEVASLACALEDLTGDSIVVYGDVLFRRYILDGLLSVAGDIVVAVDALWERHGEAGGGRGLARRGRPVCQSLLDEAPRRRRGCRAARPER